MALIKMNDVIKKPIIIFKVLSAIREKAYKKMNVKIKATQIEIN